MNTLSFFVSEPYDDGASNLNVYVGTDNKIHFTDWSGADTALPFSGKTTHTETYTYAANSTGGTVDLTVDHTYRYINADNVYTKGKADGRSVKYASKSIRGSGSTTFNFSVSLSDLDVISVLGIRITSLALSGYSTESRIEGSMYNGTGRIAIGPVQYLSAAGGSFSFSTSNKTLSISLTKANSGVAGTASGTVYITYI